MTTQLPASQLGPTECQTPVLAQPPDGRARSLAPGLLVTGVATTVVLIVGQFVHVVSPLLIAILAGAVAANVTNLPTALRPGLTFAAKKLLRIGVALLGLQLMLGDIVGLGAGVVAVVVAIVTLGIFGTMLVGRLLGLSWTQRLLIACGFSICRAAAVLAVDGVVEADDEEVVTAVALVVIFGTCMIPLLPLLAAALGLGELAAGIWAGGAIHEVGQVVAAGGAIGGQALAVAVVVKLARVVMLAPVMAAVSVRQRWMTDQATGVRHPPLVPLFVLAFLACATLRTTGVLPASVLAAAKLTQTTFLTAAMFALGAGVNVAALRKIGLRPFALAGISTLWVSCIALAGVLLVA